MIPPSHEVAYEELSGRNWDFWDFAEAATAAWLLTCCISLARVGEEPAVMLMEFRNPDGSDIDYSQAPPIGV